MTIKDSLDTRGMISAGGTLGRKDYVPSADATVVRRLREAGAILMGKTNTPELTLSFDTNNLVYGQTRNPWDLTRSPGGSSGGAAAIVAAGGSPFDIGSDYGGSIRLPAHGTGICGIKPTSGRVPRTGHIYPFGGIQDGFQQIGPLARSVGDLALLLPVIMGPDGIDPGALPLRWRSPESVDIASLRVAWYADNGIATPTAATREAVRDAAQALGEFVATVVEARPEDIEATLDVALPIYFWDGGAAVRRLLSDAGTSRHTLESITGSEATTPEHLDTAIARLDAWRSGMLSFMNRFDVLVCPVNAEPAFPAGAELGEEMIARASYSIAFNATGWPALTVPAGRSPEGLPIGIQLVAGPGREDQVLAAARQVEHSLGGFGRPRAV
jgi:amidase